VLILLHFISFWTVTEYLIANSYIVSRYSPSQNTLRLCRTQSSAFSPHFSHSCFIFISSSCLFFRLSNDAFQIIVPPRFHSRLIYIDQCSLTLFSLERCEMTCINKQYVISQYRTYCIHFTSATPHISILLKKEKERQLQI